MPPSRTEQQRVLVTGASGFIGSAFIARLQDAGYRVRAASRSSPRNNGADEWLQSNLDDPQDMLQLLEGVDIIVHLAGRAHVTGGNPADELAEFRRANTHLTAMLADAALAAGVERFVFISSIGVNGHTTETEPFTELSAPHPVTPYAISKLEAEQELISRMGRGMGIVMLRPALVYGANAPGNIHKLLHWIAAGRPLPSRNIDNARSFIALDNLVDLILQCIRHPAAADQLFLAADTETLPTSELAALLAEGMGVPLHTLPLPALLFKWIVTVAGRPNLYTQLYGSLIIDNSKARRLLDWTPPCDARTAVKRAGAEFMTVHTRL